MWYTAILTDKRLEVNRPDKGSYERSLIDFAVLWYKNILKTVKKNIQRYLDLARQSRDTLQEAPQVSFLFLWGGWGRTRDYYHSVSQDTTFFLVLRCTRPRSHWR